MHGSLACIALSLQLPRVAESASVLPEVEAKADIQNNYTMGTIVPFGEGAGSERFRQTGWSDTEKQFTWTTGNSAKLTLSIGESARPLNLRMRLTGLTKAPQLPSQPVTILANGKKIADWEVSQTADYTAEIPAAIAKKDGSLTIELKIPKAVSPKALRLSDDPRVLGVCCSELAITAGT
jgi:hypothetical protein